MKRTRNIAFIVELLLLFVILLFVIVTTTRVFMTSRSQSLHARHLTEAVILAESIAEVTKNTADREATQTAVGMMKEVQETPEWTGDMLAAELVFMGENGVQDAFRAELAWEEEKTPAGQFVTEQITLYDSGEEAPIYSLETGWYLEEADLLRNGM